MLLHKKRFHRRWKYLNILSSPAAQSVLLCLNSFSCFGRYALKDIQYWTSLPCKDIRYWISLRSVSLKVFFKVIHFCMDIIFMTPLKKGPPHPLIFHCTLDRQTMVVTMSDEFRPAEQTLFSLWPKSMQGNELWKDICWSNKQRP